MKKITKVELLKLVEAFHDAGENWHFHLLTPTCQFNESNQFAIFIENVGANEVFVHYSDKAEMELSNKFSKLLHGAQVMNKDNTRASYTPSKEVTEILGLIKELGEQKVKWHHHVFFPGCRFNSHTSEFELVVEDPRNTNHLLSVSFIEPKEDLKHIESAFYAQDM